MSYPHQPGSPQYDGGDAYEAYLDDARVLRHGKHLLATARSLGWQDDGEGALEFLMRRTREVALEDCGALTGREGQ